MAPQASPRELAELVERTIGALDAVRLPLTMPGTLELEESRAQLVTQMRTRILPHLRAQDLPAVVVLGGSSGSGKSTIFNSLARAELSPASVLRPTTRTPYIAVHPDDAPAMDGHHLLEMGEVVNPPDSISGIVLVDAPDLDSVDAGNRELSRRLLDAADIWLFVTTAKRYGDAMAWDLLRDAHRRGMTCAVLLNRVPEGALDTVRRDIASRMAADGMADSALMVIEDAGPHEGLLAGESIEHVRQWLERIAATHLGPTLVDRTTQAMLPQMRDRLMELADAVDMQANAVQDLTDKVTLACAPSREKLEENARQGRYGQGAPTTSWLTLASTGGALDSLAAGRKPPLLQRRRKDERDRAMVSVFDAVLASVRVGLTQAVIRAEEEIQRIWRQDVIDTEAYIAAGHEAVDLVGIVDEAEEGWKSDLALMAQTVAENSWLTHSGVAALIGSAAGGVNGAMTALRFLGATDATLNARSKLAERFSTALGHVESAYTEALTDIPVGDGRSLRLRAAQYAQRF